MLIFYIDTVSHYTLICKCMDTRIIRTQAEQELRDLAETKEKIERRMKALLKIVEACVAVEKVDIPETASQVDEPTESHTHAVRRYLQQSTEPVSPPQIRDALQGAGYVARSPKHLLITVHGILDRFQKANEVRKVENGYQWISEMDRLISQRLKEWSLGPMPKPMGKLSDMK
jgi:hypothetical protein